VDLNDVVSRTSLLIVYELQLHGIELSSELDEEPVIVLGDRYELQQVLLNLVTNAVQAVAGLEPGKPRRILLSTSCANGEAVLRVRDNGPGVPPDLLPDLFDPFVTSKAQGSGLGLALVAKIVRDHGGIVECDPAPRRTTFRVLLPMYSARDGRGSEIEAK
jgi:two-component system nitrogen regulation sensor histidine kinase GlnL